MILSNILENNYKFKDNLDVKLLKATPNDLGWDIFTLTYNAEMPITTILS